MKRRMNCAPSCRTLLPHVVQQPRLGDVASCEQCALLHARALSSVPPGFLLGVFLRPRMGGMLRARLLLMMPTQLVECAAVWLRCMLRWRACRVDLRPTRDRCAAPRRYSNDGLGHWNTPEMEC